MCAPAAGGGTGALGAAAVWRQWWREHSGGKLGAPADATGAVSGGEGRGGEHEHWPEAGDQPQTLLAALAVASSDRWPPADAASHGRDSEHCMGCAAKLRGFMCTHVHPLICCQWFGSCCRPNNTVSSFDQHTGFQQMERLGALVNITAIYKQFYISKTSIYFKDRKCVHFLKTSLWTYFLL